MKVPLRCHGFLTRQCKYVPGDRGLILSLSDLMDNFQCTSEVSNQIGFVPSDLLSKMNI